MPYRSLVAAAAILGFFGVALGASGAHALDLKGTNLETWHTASEYHLIHALAALLAAILGVPRAGWLFIAGTVLFAGSLYGLALTHLAVLGPLTPLGGVSYLAGWIVLAFGAMRAQPAR